MCVVLRLQTQQAGFMVAGSAHRPSSTVLGGSWFEKTAKAQGLGFRVSGFTVQGFRVQGTIAA